jgi:hypothetical protein
LNSYKEIDQMGVALRTASLLAIGLALIGCGKAPTVDGPGQPRAPANPLRTEANKPQDKADLPRAKAASNLPTVTLKIPGMY